MVFTGDTIFSGCQTWLMTSNVDQWLEALGGSGRWTRWTTWFPATDRW